MLENLPNIVIVTLFLGLGILALVSILARFWKNHHAPVQTVPAEVIGKHRAESFSQYAGNGKRERYVVVFFVDGKKKAFYVSPFSYDGYHLHEKGQLTYRGEKMIDFH